MTMQAGHRLKWERAQELRADLAQRIGNFLASEPFAVTWIDDVGLNRRVWRLSIREPVPITFSGIIGDVIHNLRSALDLLMVAVVRRGQPNRADNKHIHFVIGESKAAFERDLRHRTKGASPAALRMISDLKPYKGGEDLFWQLHQLDILDKHQTIIPVGAAHCAVGIRIKAPPGFPAMPDLPHIGLIPADRQFPLQDNAILFEAPFGDPMHGDDVRFQFSIAFGEGQIIDGRDVLQSLQEMSDHVDRVIGETERRLLL